MANLNYTLTIIKDAIMEHYQCPDLPLHAEPGKSGLYAAIAKRDEGVSLAVHWDPSNADIIWVSGQGGHLTIACRENSAILYCKLSTAPAWHELELANPTMSDELWGLIDQIR